MVITCYHSTDCGWWSISNILWMMIRWFIFSWRHRSVSSWNSPPGTSRCKICPRITSRIRFRGRKMEGGGQYWGHHGPSKILGFINGNWPGSDSMGCYVAVPYLCVVRHILGTYILALNHWPYGRYLHWSWNDLWLHGNMEVSYVMGVPLLQPFIDGTLPYKNHPF